jgi:hypothetical protein
VWISASEHLLPPIAVQSDNNDILCFQVLTLPNAEINQKKKYKEKDKSLHDMLLEKTVPPKTASLNAVF